MTPSRRLPRASLFALALVLAAALWPQSAAAATAFHVSPAGDDAFPGTAERPFRTPARARDAARALRQQHAGALPPGGVEIVLHAGTYPLAAPLVLGPEDSGTKDAPLRFVAAPNETVVLSGAVPLKLAFQPHAGNILKAAVPPGVRFDQLFLNDRPLVLARYPDFDPAAKHFNGTAADCLAPERVRRWKTPTTAILHALHNAHWGDMHFAVTGVDDKGNAILRGGHQNNRPSRPHPQIRFVENVFEELDAPGEWFLDTSTNTLYLIPPAGTDLASARFAGASLKHLVELRGTRENPVRFMTFSGITFSHAARTFMEPYEPLLRSDWCIYRGGAMLAEGTEDCAIAGCDFVHLGGNAVFVSRYNRRLAVTGCLFTNVGASCVAFVGDPSAVRMAGVKNYSDAIEWDKLDRTPGPKNDLYPADCMVDDCLMFHFGTVEKQVAGVQIAMAARITASRCSIYDCPRAGINIGDGCWGGHVIDACDVFDTVKETGDHGSFNSWGRDRFWALKGKRLEDATREVPNLVTLDVIEPITLRNSRWRCDHGWDIDLDDGSTNYRIYNNLCLNGGLKNREGFLRTVENNVIVNNTFHPHVWYPDSGDVFRRNIVMAAYRPIRVPHWGKEVDFNLFPDDKALQAARKNGTDKNSAAGDPQFVDPAAGDFRVKDTSPALALGFKNFPMERFGVASERLRKLARTPPLTGKTTLAASKRDGTVRDFAGARVKNIVGLGEQSAYGLPGETGVLIVDAPADSPLAKAGLKKGDVILAAGKTKVDSFNDLAKAHESAPAGSPIPLTVHRDQAPLTVELRK